MLELLDRLPPARRRLAPAGPRCGPHSLTGAEPLDDNADVEGGGDLSPRAQRKLSHNQVEVRRRRRISMQLDRLKSLLHCEKTDKASILSEAVTQITVHAPACPTRARSTTHRPPHF